MKKTNISIVGLGGVGGYFGFKLARKYQQHSDIDIAFVARLATYEAVKKNGLTLVSPEHADNTVKPDQLFKSVKEITRPGVIIICAKEYDLEKICTDLKDKVTNDSVILPLMNGVDIYERIRAIIPNGIVLPSCVYVAAHIKEKGVVEHKGNAGRIIIGNDPDKQAYKLRWLIQLLQQAGIDVTYKENAYSDIWTKFIFIASFGLVSARYNKSIGQVNETPHLHQRAMMIMKEIKAIDESKNSYLPDDIIEKSFQKSTSFPYHTPTSLQLDIQSGKTNNELSLFAGAIIHYGHQMNIAVLETEKIYREIMECLPAGERVPII